MRKAICPKQRLALTLRFLATGESFHSLEYQFRISREAISYIIDEVCKAIVDSACWNLLKISIMLKGLDKYRKYFQREIGFLSLNKRG